MATVVITPNEQRQFHDLPLAIRARIKKIFVRLEKWPDVSGAKSLSGDLAGHSRIRTGDYRVQFRVVGAAVKGISRSTVHVVVEKVGHRDKFYED